MQVCGMTSSGHVYLQRSALCSMPWSRLVYGRRRRAFFWERVFSVWPACCPEEWLWVDSIGINGKPTFRRRGNLSWLSPICNRFGEIAALSRKSREDFSAKVAFWKKKTPYGQIFKNVFRKDSWRYRSTFCVQISCNLADQKSARASGKQWTQSAPNFIKILSLPAEL